MPVVVADFMKEDISCRMTYRQLVINMTLPLDKWNIGDGAADYIYTRNKILDYSLRYATGNL